VNVGPIAPVAPDRWAPHVAALGAALVGRGGHRHGLSLALAGELLHRDVNPAHVPAIVHDVAVAAGWLDPYHHRKNAVDTVSRWADGDPVRRDVPPVAAVALDHATSMVSPLAVPLAESQRRLREAIAHGGDGLTVVRAPCGLGKTRATEDVAATRTDRTVISAPTNDLARQITEHLRDRGLGVLRVYGPASVDGPDACRYRAAAAALARGGQSIRWELCDGRGVAPCMWRESCRAADGSEGPEDADIVVGNHGLLGELNRRAGAKGLLVVDEPPHVLEDLVLDAGRIARARAALGAFEGEAAVAIAPALRLAELWLSQAPDDTPAHLGDVDVAPDDELDDLLASAGELTVAAAAARAIRRGRVPLRQANVVYAREHLPTATSLGEASETLLAVHRAVTAEDVSVTVYDAHRTRQRCLAVTGVHRHLRRALRRDGRVVVMAADAQLYRTHYELLVGYQPPFVDLGAPDGVAVRRVLIESSTANRRRWITDGRRPVRLLEQALAVAREAGPRVAVVTFMALEPWVADVAPGVDVGHYGALRGLDHWKDHDALITLGDPVPNLHFVARTVRGDEAADDRARDLARAELEQAHGRLRVVHRTTPCTMVHVGSLVPCGWRQPVEVHETAKGRPPQPGADVRAVVEAAGGVDAVAIAVGVSDRSVRRWVEKGRAPTEVVAHLQLISGSDRSQKHDPCRTEKGSIESCTTLLCPCGEGDDEISRGCK